MRKFRNKGVREFAPGPQDWRVMEPEWVQKESKGSYLTSHSLGISSTVHACRLQSLLPADIFVAPKQSQSRRPCKQSSLIHDLWYAASEEYFPAWNVPTPSSYTLAQHLRARSEPLEFLGTIVNTSDHPRETDLVVPQASKRGLRRPRAQEHVLRLKESADDKWEKTFQIEWI